MVMHTRRVMVNILLIDTAAQGHDSVLVCAPDLQSWGTGFNPRQRPTEPGAHQDCHTSEVGELVPAAAGRGVKSPLYGHGLVNVGLLLAPFQSSLCSWSVSCKADPGHYRRKQKNHNFEL